MRKLAIDLQILIAVAITLLTIGLAYVDIPLIGSFVRLIGVFVVPGWLFTNVLFGNRKGPDQETRFILVFGLGVVLVALELVLLPLIGIRISQESIVLSGAFTSSLLAAVLILRLRTDRDGLDKIPVLSAMPLSVAVILVLCIFVPIHQPIVNESYTEFYLAPSPSVQTDDGATTVELIITSHEQEDYTYTVFCKDTSGSEKLLLKSLLKSESRLVVELSVPPPRPGLVSKMWLSLHREGDNTTYRWVELVGGGCDLLSTRDDP
jgi:uncharacterized membrane protein